MLSKPASRKQKKLLAINDVQEKEIAHLHAVNANLAAASRNAAEHAENLLACYDRKLHEGAADNEKMHSEYAKLQAAFDRINTKLPAPVPAVSQTAVVTTATPATPALNSPAAPNVQIGSFQIASNNSGSDRPLFVPTSDQTLQSGNAKLIVEIAPDGSVRNVEVYRSSGNAQLDDALQQVVAHSTWLPKQGFSDGPRTVTVSASPADYHSVSVQPTTNL